MAKFKGGDKIICIGAGWRQGRPGYIEAIAQETEGESAAVYHVYFPDINRKSYITENEIILDERVDIAPNEVLILDADHVNPDMASEVAQRLGRFTLLVKGGKKNVDKMDRTSLRTALDTMDKVLDTPVDTPKTPKK